jgi:thiamine-monophosphate kinase
MKVSELGEFGLIDILAKMVYRTRDEQAPAWEQLIVGIGDDAAAWHGDTSTQLATVDSFIQDVHFSLDITPWNELGWKALAVNLSDIAAMGGMPRYAVVSLVLPSHTEVEDITALYQGIIELSQEFGVAIIGGDTGSAPLVAINITVLGNMGSQDISRSQNKKLLTRSGAKSGDKIAVTGYLGMASAGWEMLTRRLQFDTDVTARFKKAFLHPYPRIAEGQLLLRQGVETAIDISDGLISDLKHICQASRLGARIDATRVPVCPDVRAGFGNRALELALSGGEDYELLFTGSTEIIDKVKMAAPCPITVIGEMSAHEENEISVVNSQGNPLKLHSKGWEHFINTSNS